MSKVKTDKLIKEAEEVTGEVIKRLEEDENVTGIVLSGSYVHGKTTQPSNVNLDVLTRVRKKSQKQLLDQTKK